MVATGLVLLSQNDTDAPADLPAVGTCSKDEPGDDGGFALGAAAAARGVTWCDRFFWTGNPDPTWVAGRCDDALEAGAAFAQVGNELNLELEGFQGGPEAYFALEDAVRSHVVDPSRLLAMPPSPGVPGWEAWVRDVGDHACHAYGSFDGMRSTVEWFLANTTGAVVVTECNFGAGNAVDVTAWATGELDPFLSWCASQPRVKACLWFAWRWDQSPTLPASVDACACPAVVEVLQKYAVAPVPPDPPPNGGGTVPDDITLSVPTTVALASPANYQPGPRAATIGVVVHTTRGGAASLSEEYAGTVGWFRNPSARVSAHLVVGPEEVARCVHDDDVAWHARNANAAFLGIEIAQPTITSAITDFQYRAAAEACRKWAQKYGFPLARVMSITQAGLVGHEDAEPGIADGKTDPGTPPSGVFDWERFLALCRDAPVPTDPTALQEAAWALGDQLQKLGPPYEAAGYPHRAAYVRNQGEALKEWVNTASKNQP